MATLLLRRLLLSYHRHTFIGLGFVCQQTHISLTPTPLTHSSTNRRKLNTRISQRQGLDFQTNTLERDRQNHKSKQNYIPSSLSLSSVPFHAGSVEMERGPIKVWQIYVSFLTSLAE